MNIEHYTIAMLARAMWHAGRLYTENLDTGFAELAGHLIRNRVVSGAGQIGWLQAINETTFSVSINEVDRAEDPRFLKILWEAERLYLNQAFDKLDGALDYSPAAIPGRAIVLTAPIAGGKTLYFYREPVAGDKRWR
jgi:hypothetical protein